MLTYKSTSGSPLIRVIADVIEICKALEKQKLYSYVRVEFNDITFGVNEKSNVDNTVNEIYDKIKRKYECEGGVDKPMLHSGAYWLDVYKNKE